MKKARSKDATIIIRTNHLWRDALQYAVDRSNSSVSGTAKVLLERDPILGPLMQEYMDRNKEKYDELGNLK